MEKIKVGTIINTHGIKGELKIDRTGTETFDRDINYYIGNSEKKYQVESSKIHKGYMLIKLKGFDNINDVLNLKSKSIYISKEDLIDLDFDEFYVADLIGIHVFENEKHLGIVKDILEYSANDVYVIDAGEREILIPAVDEFILNIDLENKKMDVRLIEGM